MTENTLIINSSSELLDEVAEASISLNPVYQWAKIVVCDSEPNGNGYRIPEEEFNNLISTGISAPIKMARNKISDGHAEAYGNPIGVISQLKKEGNKVIALAALWKRERPEDVEKLKEMYTRGNPPNVSWEILYSSYVEEANGVKALKDCILNGLAVVGMPAYQGRTPFIAMSSMDTEEVTAELGEASVWTRAYIESLPDTAFLYVVDGNEENAKGMRYFPYRNHNGDVDVPHLQNAIASLNKYSLETSITELIEQTAQKLLQDTNSNLEENKQKMEELEKLQTDLTALQATLDSTKTDFDAQATELSELKNKYETMESEFKVLKEFKDNLDAQNEKLERLASIKTKFKEAGIEKEDSYFTEKEATLLGLSTEELEFMIQELASFKSEAASIVIPQIFGDGKVTKEDLVAFLRERKNKK